MKRYHVSVIVGLAVLACNNLHGDTAAERSSRIVSDSSPAGMSGVRGMAGSSMMAAMPAHLDSMAQMKPEQMSQTMAQVKADLADLPGSPASNCRRN
jgi:hypothetical protein